MLLYCLFLGTFIQPATTVGSSSVCVGGSQTFNCTIEVYIITVGIVIPDAVWSRDGDIITDSTPRHTLLRTNIEQRQTVTGLMVHNTTLDDIDAVYTCTADGAPGDFTSNVTLNIVEGKIPYSGKFLKINIFRNFQNLLHFPKFYFRKISTKVVYQPLP